MRTVFDGEAEETVQAMVRMVSWQPPEEAVVMDLPEGFTHMEDQRREEYFPLADRPEVILEYGEEDAQITLQIFDRRMKEEEAEAAARQVLKVVEERFVQYPCSPVYLETGGEIMAGWFSMKMKDIGREHVKAVFSIKGHMALLTFTYPEEACAKWRVVCGMLLRSVKEGKTDGTDRNWRF